MAEIPAKKPKNNKTNMQLRNRAFGSERKSNLKEKIIIHACSGTAYHFFHDAIRKLPTEQSQ